MNLLSSTSPSWFGFSVLLAFLAFSEHLFFWGLISFQCSQARRMPHDAKSITGTQKVFHNIRQVPKDGEGGTYCVLRTTVRMSNILCINYSHKGNHKAARELSFPVSSVCLPSTSPSPLLWCNCKWGWFGFGREGVTH